MRSPNQRNINGSTLLLRDVRNSEDSEEDTLFGYLVDSLVWCGQSIDPGMNYTRCPSWSDCPSEASEAFWAMASKTVRN